MQFSNTSLYRISLIKLTPDMSLEVKNDETASYLLWLCHVEEFAGESNYILEELV